MKSLFEYINEGMTNRRISTDPKDVVSTVTPALDYIGETGVIIGGLWNINKRSDMNKARTLIKSLGLKIENDIDDLTGYGDNINMETAWTGGKNFAYFYSPLVDEVNAYIFNDTGVMVLK